MAERRVSLSTLAVIPARGGSKRIPRKNIRPFLGVPLLTRTIAMLRDTEVFDRIVASTDDDEVAEVAQAAGVEVPFRRPANLANDTTPTAPVVAHAIRELESAGLIASYVCCVYPAAVLSRPSDFRAAWEILREKDVDYVFPVASFPHPIERALRKTRDSDCEMVWPEYRDVRSQDLEPAFHDAGQFYFGRREAWLGGGPLLSRRSRMIEVPRYRVQDIDTPEDWERAELILRLLREEKHLV